jgi:ribosomal protein S18 acetylase RimI-like enzyme
MGRLELIAFTEDHLDDAGRLLAERHRRHRRVEPLLPGRYEHLAEARSQVAAILEDDTASGIAAFRDGAMVGYMIGHQRPEPAWGSNAWVETAGHAADQPETIRDLYGAAAGAWWERGLTRHSALVPAFDPVALDAWWRLGFGQQQALAIQEVHAEQWPPTVRLASAADVDAAVVLAPIVDSTHLASPVFSGIQFHNSVDDLRDEFLEDVSDESYGVLLAETEGVPSGLLVVVPIERSTAHAGLARADGECLLAFAATAPEVRGSGVGLALTAAAFAWAAGRGYSSMATDWRVTNLLSSRFWTSRGFRPTFLRLYRSLP